MAGRRPLPKSNVVRAVLHLCGLSGVADASKEMQDALAGDRHLTDTTDEIGRWPAAVSTILQKHQQHEFPRLADNDRLAAEAAVERTLRSVTNKELITAGLKDSALVQTKVLAAGGRRERAELLSIDAQEYFDSLLGHCCVVVAEWLLETDSHGAVERVGIAELLRASDRVERILADRYDLMIEQRRRDREQFSTFTLRYLQRVREQLDYLEIPGLDLQSVRQRYSFSSAYVPLVIEDAGTQRRRAVVRAQDLVTPGRVTLVIGEPGSGKSTLGKLVLTGLAEEAETALHRDAEYSVPLLVKLRATTGLPPELDDVGGWLTKSLPVRRPDDWQHALLEAGRAVVVVDGLDEIGRNERHAVVGWLKSLAAEFPRSGFVITSRPAALDTVQIPAEWSQYRLQPLERRQISRLVVYWHRSVARQNFASDEAATTAALAFLARVDRYPELRSLCGNPLLVASLCGLAAARAGEIPPRRADLYRDLVGMMVMHRDSERDVAGLITVGQTALLLSAIAVHCQRQLIDEGSREDFLAMIRAYQQNVKDDRLRDLRAGLILDHLLVRSGLLRDIPVGRIDWAHRSFREFLAAQHFVARGAEAELLRAARNRDWAEIISWTVELLPTAERTSRMVDGLLDEATELSDRHIRALALRGASAARELQAGTLRRTQALLAGLVPPTSRAAAQVLLQIGSGAVPALATALGAVPSDQEFRSMAAILLAIGTESAIDALASQDPARLEQIADELASNFATTASVDLAHRVLSKVPPGLPQIGLRLRGSDFLGALSVLSPRYRVDVLRLDHAAADEDLVVSSAVDVAMVDAVELEPLLALRLIRRLGRVSGARLTWDSIHTDKVGLAEQVALGSLRRLDVVSDLFALDNLRPAEALQELCVSGAVEGALADVAGGPQTVVLGTADRVDLYGATERLKVGSWHAADLESLTRLVSLRCLYLGSAPRLTTLAGLGDLAALDYLRIDDAPELAVSADELLASDVAHVIIDRCPYLGVGLTPDQLSLLGLRDVPPGFGATDLPELVAERWRLPELADLTVEEVDARGWDDWSFWLELNRHSDRWDDWTVREPQSEDEQWSEHGYIVIDSLAQEGHHATGATDVWFSPESPDEDRRSQADDPWAGELPGEWRDDDGPDPGFPGD